MTETTTSRPTTPGEAAPGGDDRTDGAPSPETGSCGAPAGAAGDENPRRTAALVASLVALVAGIPLVVALAVLRQPRWFPLLDLAQTELRLRAFSTGDPPLVGLAGRINGVDADGVRTQGSHPGPLSFWALWPFYQVAGGSAWAMQVASAALNLIAVGVALWIAHRRGGRMAALVAAVALVVLAHSYGADKLTEAWNPYMPMLWWVVMLLAVWSVVCDDLAMLPVAVFAGSLCMQTHIPYSGLVLGLGLGTVLWLVTHRRPGRTLRWSLAALALLVVLWAPPVIDQLTNEPGNLSLIKQTFTDPPAGFDDDPVGLGTHAVQIWLAHLNPWTLLVGTSSTMAEAATGTWLPGLFVLSVWLVSVVVAWRSEARSPALLRLHLVVAAALVLGLVSISRILGFVWYYLVLWAWGTAALVLVAVVATFVLAWPRRPPLARLARPGAALLAASLVAFSAWFTWDAAHTEVPAETESRILAHTAPATVAALREDGVLGGGFEGRYLLEFTTDQVSIGAQGFGMLLALERAGLDVGVDRFFATGAGEQRVLDRDEATGVIHYVVGPQGIDRWRAAPEAVEVAYYEPRTAGQRERYDELHDQVASNFRADGLDGLAEALDGNLLSTALHEDTSPEQAERIQAMMRLGLPTAVFLAPVGVNPP